MAATGKKPSAASLRAAIEAEKAARDEALDIRIESARLAAMCCNAVPMPNGMGPRLFALCKFFETYIATGADTTEQAMPFLTGNTVKRAHA